ncbi:MAG TPA: sigma 54-interacting transcriptional regulator [Verrucomicrobiae bacterium]|nr:sigma 54-interacting transcriptional regulator [Verrucomicrobiae bacterium]
MKRVRVGFLGEEEPDLQLNLAELGYLRPVLDCLQECVEITDNRGNVIYVNDTFNRLAGLTSADWVGKNVFEAAPQTPLIQVLVSQQPVYNQRAVVQGNEVMANAVPLIINGHMCGGVMTWLPLTHTGRLQEELNQSNTLIENLYARMQQVAGAKFTFDSIIGTSKTTKSAVEAARKAAKTDSTVLILGESGTGKELYAHAIHQASRRRNKPFIKLNCNGIPESLMEDELFGHEKGAYPGAIRTHIGRLELANGGTLFLDEVANLNLFIQDKLLRVLEHWEFFRVGGAQPVRVDVRVIASSNRDLRAMVREGKFREQLLYRLNSQELCVPALRQRREDIPLFVNYLMVRFNRKLGTHIKGVSPQALQILMGYDWPGNVRELEHVVERAMLSCKEAQLTHKHLAEYLSHVSGGLMQAYDIMPMKRMEEILLRAALARYGDNLEGKKKAAQSLNISLATLYNKLKKYDI